MNQNQMNIHDLKNSFKNLWEIHKELMEQGKFKDENFIKNLYEDIANLLIAKGTVQTTIDDLFELTPEKINYNIYVTESEIKNKDVSGIYSEHCNNYNKNDPEYNFGNNTKWSDAIETIIYSCTNILNDVPNGDYSTNIDLLLRSIANADKITIKLKKELIKLLEKHLNLFTVDVKDNKLKDGYRRKYYKIDSKSNTYQEINRGWLQQYFIQEYPTTQLHETPNFYEDVLSRINDLKIANNNYLEFENVYIDKRNYRIFDKKEKTDIFTKDRLYYEDYNTNNIKLYYYNENINIYDILNNRETRSLAVDTMYKIFVPRNKPDDFRLFLYILQTIGMMVLGRNPAKRITILYDETEKEKNRTEGDSGKSTARKIIQEIFKDSNGDLNDKILNDNFMINSIEQASHFLFMDELRGNELEQHIHTLKRLSSGYEYNGRKTYDNKQVSVNVPPIIISMNGVPKLPLHDTAYIGRYVLCKVPNVFKPEEKVNPKNNEYPEVSNIIEQIKQDPYGLSQLISLAINEYITLDQNKSIRDQLALNPSIEETILTTTRADVVRGILKAYTRPIARSSNHNDWVSIGDLQTKIRQVYKKSNKKEINPALIDNTTIGYKLKEIYPNLFGAKKDRDANKKRDTKNGGNIYNITLLTNEELEQEENEIIFTKPIRNGYKIMDPLEQKIYNTLKAGTNTIDKLNKEFEEIYNPSEIQNALEGLYNSDLIDYSHYQSYV